MSSTVVNNQSTTEITKSISSNSTPKNEVKKEIKKEPASNSSSSTSINKDKNGKTSDSKPVKKDTNGTTNGSSSNNKSVTKTDSTTKLKSESNSHSKSFSEIDSKKKVSTSSSSPAVNKSTSSSNDKQPTKKIKTEPDTPSTPASSKKTNGSTNGTKPVINGNKTPNSSTSSKTAVKTEAKSPAVKHESKTPVKQESKTPSKPTPSSAKSTPSSSSKSKSDSKNNKKRSAEETPTQESPKKRKKKEEEEEEVWRWWEEKKYADGRKWTTLEHKGPVFDPGYTPLPDNIHFFYNGERVKLSVDAEEVMTFYAKMLDHDYTKKDIFNTNFFNDWRKFMTDSERSKIKDLKKCDFSKVFEYFKKISEERKLMSKEEKKAIKEENLKIKKEYGNCIWDGHKQPIGNYKIEPPGLFRGRGEHPKMGMVKKRINPEDVIINCGKDSKIPQPPPGRKWKEVRHDNMVAWLCSWTENVQGNTKYVMLNAASRVKGERDWQKYEKARKLHRCIDKIRQNYLEDWKSKEMKVRQRAVAIYFIDKLALRAGNEKDEDEADTVGCCSLRIEHIKLHKDVDGVGEHVVEFDFLGKDSIRYQNKVAVEKQVYKNLTLFMENKNRDDELFDRLNTTILNTYLNEIMEGLSAKVFRTYNASRTLQEQLDQMTNGKDSVNDKILSYNRANRAVAILCNHQRAVPKTFAKSMENMQQKIQAKKDQIREAEKELKNAKSDLKNLKTVAAKKKYESKEKALEKLKEGLRKLEIQVTDKEENKDIALGTSKLNYLDPRISVAWCKKHSVPVEKIYSKTQRDKFRWAIDMATSDYHFYNYEGEIQLRDLSHLEGMDNTQDDTQDDQDETQNDDDEDED